MGRDKNEFEKLQKKIVDKISDIAQKYGMISKNTSPEVITREEVENNVNQHEHVIDEEYTQENAPSEVEELEKEDDEAKKNVKEEAIKEDTYLPPVHEKC